jgi:hypothetical protein
MESNNSFDMMEHMFITENKRLEAIQPNVVGRSIRYNVNFKKEFEMLIEASFYYLKNIQDTSIARDNMNILLNNLSDVNLAVFSFLIAPIMMRPELFGTKSKTQKNKARLWALSAVSNQLTLKTHNCHGNSITSLSSTTIISTEEYFRLRLLDRIMFTK